MVFEKYWNTVNLCALYLEIDRLNHSTFHGGLHDLYPAKITGGLPLG